MRPPPSGSLVWFRRDLRDFDNAALASALATGGPVWCAFVFDREILDALPSRADRRVEFIRESVVELDASLRRQGGGLIVLVGRARDAIPELASRLGVAWVWANRDHEPAAIDRDGAVGRALTARSIGWRDCKDHLVFERDEILTRNGGPYTVFTPYRRAWLAALAYLVLPYLLALVLAIGLQTAGAQHSAGGSVMWLLYLGAFFLGPPLAANSLYYAHTKRLIDRHRAGARSREQFLALLEAKGGTSNIALVVIALLAVVFVVGILAAVAIPAYQDYTKRAKSSEAILAGMSVATQISEQFARTGKIPSSLDAFRSRALLSKYVTDMRIDPKNGVIEMQVVFGPDAGGGKIYLIPEAKDGRAVTWSCRAEPAMARYVPSSCRGQ